LRDFHVNLKSRILAVVCVYFFGNQQETSTAAAAAVLSVPPVVASVTAVRPTRLLQLVVGSRQKIVIVITAPDSRHTVTVVNIADCRLPDITKFPSRASPSASVGYYFDIVNWSRCRLNFSAFANSHHRYSNSTPTRPIKYSWTPLWNKIEK